jgi:predicted ATPase
MIKSLSLKSFTVFGQADIQFAPGMNVIIGANGTGKSHLLKVAYSAAYDSAKTNGDESKRAKSRFQTTLADGLNAVLQPDQLGRLVSRQPGRKSASILIGFENAKADFGYSFSTNSLTDVRLDATPEVAAPSTPIFFPPKEILSWYPGFRQLYHKREISIDRTYADLCDALALPLLRGARPKDKKVASYIDEIESATGGPVRFENGRFYFHLPTGKMEAPLMAEGLRKLGTLGFLIGNGSLDKETTLFWDEPESNLNPRILKQTVEIMMGLCQLGFQIICATHSLFLLKEIHILSKQMGLPALFTSLKLDDGYTTAEQVDSIDLLPEIPSLDADLEQSTRFEL